MYKEISQEYRKDDKAIYVKKKYLFGILYSTLYRETAIREEVEDMMPPNSNKIGF
jgi:hypothetical protein